ncbi:MAG TPA: hypothetical protein VF521_07725 [Pyrinomonadaceae bacterium]
MDNLANAYGQAPCAGWAESLRSSDAGQVWRRLHRLVRNHPLAHTSSGTNVAAWAAADSHEDLTQELFVTLLCKDRFRHYLDAGMTDREIEREIAQIELTNLLTTGLRKRYPESYRLARRISILLQTSGRFRRFDRAGRDGRCRGLTEKVYGLSRWPDGTPSLPHAELERRAASVPVRRRDLKVKGCTGDSQVVIGNPELEGLVVEVLEATGAPADVRTIRALVMSRLPVMDVRLTQFPNLGEGEDSGGGQVFEPADVRPTPEQEALRRDGERRGGEHVREFLRLLGEEVRGKARQYERILSVLRLCYLSPEHPTQLEVAERLGVSDSLVCDYRRRIERALRSLPLTSIEEARRFEEELRVHMQAQRGTCPSPDGNHVREASLRAAPHRSHATSPSP